MTDINTNINLLGHDEQQLRLERLESLMMTAGIDAALICDNTSLFYLTGRVFRGYMLIGPGLPVRYFVRQPQVYTATEPQRLWNIRKPEDIMDLLRRDGYTPNRSVALEADVLSFSTVQRLNKALGQSEVLNISPVLRSARSVKTPMEQAAMEESGQRQSKVYERAAFCYTPGMTDFEFQIEIEWLSRMEGCLGQFRVAGGEMELFMGNVLAGDNADNPSPYDFAMGGAGLHPSIPVGANRTVIEHGMPVMVDVNGNYTGYMTDMTRMYIVGEAPEAAQRALQVSRDICSHLSKMMFPGAPASVLYEKAAEMAREAGLEDYFMGHRAHAGFVGHGVGIEVNELPVISPRSRDILQEGNTIALEPKFVIPGIGAVGIENTYIVEATGGRCITLAPETMFVLE